MSFDGFVFITRSCLSDKLIESLYISATPPLDFSGFWNLNLSPSLLMVLSRFSMFFCPISDGTMKSKSQFRLLSRAVNFPMC